MRHRISSAPCILLIALLAGCSDSIASKDDLASFPERIDHFTMADGLARNEVHAAAVCPNGDGWFAYGAGGNGITRFDGSRWRTFTEKDGLPRDYVHALACDRQNAVWIGYGVNAGGLTRYDGRTWITYTEQDGLSSNQVETISAGPDGEQGIPVVDYAAEELEDEIRDDS